MTSEDVLQEIIDKQAHKIKCWEDYVKDLEEWFYEDYPDDMTRYMMKPNKPGYYRANND